MILMILRERVASVPFPWTIANTAATLSAISYCNLHEYLDPNTYEYSNFTSGFKPLLAFEDNLFDAQVYGLVLCCE